MPNENATEAPVSVASIKNQINNLKLEFQQAAEGEPLQDGYLARLEQTCESVHQIDFESLTNEETKDLESILVLLQQLGETVGEQQKVVKQNIDANKNQKKLKSAYSF